MSRRFASGGAVLAVALALVLSATAVPLLGGTAVADPLFEQTSPTVALLNDPPAVGTYSPKQGALFNNPTIPDQRRMIIRHIQKSIGSTPAGATIRIALYSFDVASAADALVAAHQRGVHVRMIMDDHYMTPEWQRMIDELGTDADAESFAITCHGSCMVDHEKSSVHLKLYMFSTSGTSKLVSMVSSSNLTHGQTNNGWNDIYTIVGSRGMYGAYKRYFEDMTAGALGTKNPFYYRMVESGNKKTYLSPRGEPGRDNDTMMEIFDNIECTGADPGFGTKDGRTIIKITMYSWTTGRLAVAKKLWRLNDMGCAVSVIYFSGSTWPEVLAELSKPGSRGGGIKLRDSARDSDADGVIDLWTHNKYVLIDGHYAGETDRKIVFAGSHNMTYNAMHWNNDILLKVDRRDAHAAYLAQFMVLRDYLKSTPPPTLAKPLRLPADSLRDELDLDD